MTLPTELTTLQRTLLARALLITAAQFDEVEGLIKEKLGVASPEPELVTAVAQVLATNYLATATVRNAPKS